MHVAKALADDAVRRDKSVHRGLFPQGLYATDAASSDSRHVGYIFDTSVRVGPATVTTMTSCLTSSLDVPSEDPSSIRAALKDMAVIHGREDGLRHLMLTAGRQQRVLLLHESPKLRGNLCLSANTHKACFKAQLDLLNLLPFHGDSHVVPLQRDDDSVLPCRADRIYRSNRQPV